MTKLDVWLELAKMEIRMSPVNERTLKQAIAVIEKLKSALEWIVPKVHQAYHDGELDVCQKATCDVYNEALAIEPEKLINDQSTQD